MRKYLAEFLGTFILVFCGTGAIVINELNPGLINHSGIAFTFGAVVLAMIYSFGDISGAHLNPAVTLAFVADKKLKVKELLPYTLSQFSGALLASFLLIFLFPDSQKLGATQPSGGIWQSFMLEIILTFILMLVIFRVSQGAKEKGITAGIAVSSVVALEAMFAGPICGASMNPARSLAPALVSGFTSHLWIYILAPCLGALLAFLTEKTIQFKK